jgi:membrane-bound ClpP family serine protease
MQYSVPQFIDVEDKIVGPFTGKQTLYLIIGGGFLLIAFRLFNFAFFAILALPVVVLTLLFTFYKPKGISVAKYTANFIDYVTAPHLYIWKREPDMTMYKVVQKKQEIHEEPIKYVSRNRIRELANLLDTSTSVDALYEADTRPDENIFGR